MWRLLIVVCVGAGTARADDAKAVDAVIRGALDGPQQWTAPAGQLGWYEQLAGVKLVGPSGVAIASEDELAHELIVCDQIGAPIGMTIWKLGAVTSGIDGKAGFAWFQAPVEVDIICAAAGFAAPSAQDKLRASGIIVREKTRWKLVALALSRQLPDTKLFKGATRSPAAGEPSLDGSTAAAAAKAWFTKGGLARAKASDAVASGTAPGEYATGAGVATLVAAWDKIGLRPDSIEATVFAGGAIALIRAVVPLPVKKKAAPMTLYAIAILDGKAWRWVSLQFTSELATAPHAETPDTTGVECPNGKC